MSPLYKTFLSGLYSAHHDTPSGILDQDQAQGNSSENTLPKSSYSPKIYQIVFPGLYSY